jgi:hypothetical protein
MTDRDPWSGPLAGVTGRLERLKTEHSELQSPNADPAFQLGRLVFEVGMLIDLVEELAWKTAELLPEDGD